MPSAVAATFRAMDMPIPALIVSRVLLDSFLMPATSDMDPLTTAMSEDPSTSPSPPPMEIPTVAALSAAESFTPSPTMHTAPSELILLTMRCLSAGRHSHTASSTPASEAMALAGPSLSPVSMMVLTPSERRLSTVALDSPFTTSLSSKAPHRRPSTATMAPDPRPMQSIPRSLMSPGPPTATEWPSTVPRTPFPGRYSNPSTRGSSSSTEAATALPNGCSDMDSTAAA